MLRCFGLLRLLLVCLVWIVPKAACAVGFVGVFYVKVNVLVSVPVPVPVPPLLCVSQSLGVETGAKVSVLCGSDQVVQIEQDPGRPTLGVHGGSFIYALSRFGRGANGADSKAQPPAVSSSLVSPGLLPASTQSMASDSMQEVLITF